MLFYKVKIPVICLHQPVWTSPVTQSLAWGGSNQPYNFQKWQIQFYVRPCSIPQLLLCWPLTRSAVLSAVQLQLCKIVLHRLKPSLMFGSNITLRNEKWQQQSKQIVCKLIDGHINYVLRFEYAFRSI